MPIPDPNPNISTAFHLPPWLLCSVASSVVAGGGKGRGTFHQFEGQDEESLLIPSNVESPTIERPPLSHSEVLDRQHLKERMGLIVQSKGGKMVNVNSRVPFNLHNKKIAVTLDPSPSSSRGSASLSSHSRSHTNGQAHWQVQAHVGAPVTNNIPSSSSSITSQDGVSTDFEGFTRSPILNLRLRPLFLSGFDMGLSL
ncbi:uncharacterized protein LACBIDRAFT_334397 [Laccaria bicolor S238N-H82]|uniref:Predicted protein n=1 Tax=Laccaria bicolor (strain S238N-H82 / ATCC MYA-4686) TaxID=486041 RepID=B0DZ35_LACBS|nr:uncharacterized protein LACBIDRAFT_334397 [Laccaria bicolor S238N-H82]EDR00123.1 predicted protein [Laccaria bicolor S238N-H82]|eukprot:XP_001889180.1 predicted protein [Laccaria bicolor S238N-H82]